MHNFYEFQEENKENKRETIFSEIMPKSFLDLMEYINFLIQDEE